MVFVGMLEMIGNDWKGKQRKSDKTESNSGGYFNSCRCGLHRLRTAICTWDIFEQVIIAPDPDIVFCLEEECV